VRPYALRKAELDEALTCELDAHTTADTLLQATRTVEDSAMRAKRATAPTEREVRFLQVLNVRFPS
jgi:hypothetical protein